MHSIFNDRRYLIPFRATLLPQIFTDVLVIGSGVAGLRAAIEVAQQGRDVIVATKSKADRSSTAWAQGGIAAVLDEDDSIDSHVNDTMNAGAGLCDESVVRTVVEGGKAAIDELMAWGMRFDRESGGDGEGMALGREGGHSCHRVVHSDGDATGRELARALIGKVRGMSDVRLFDDCFVLDLVTSDGDPPLCLGAITHHPKFGLQMIWARATVLATGGCGQVFRESTNPNVATGDGMAMAYRAGARLADMAFMQFHPTTLYIAGASRALITEAVRGEGALLIDNQGHRFMPEYHEMAELAPRDVVSRAILKQMARVSHSHIYLDCRPIGARFAERFPGICQLLEKFELDPTTDPIPIHPSAHYMIGGVEVDAEGRTNLPGLFACGEVSCTGLHGANRLASNSLLEGMVFGKAVGQACVGSIENGDTRPAKIISDIPLSSRGELDLADVQSSFRSVMWRHVGIERNGDKLGDVADMFDFWARYTLDKIFDEREGWEVQNQLLIGALMTRAATWREESRGTHYRSDFASPVEAFCRHDVWSRHRDEPEVRSVDGTVRGA